MQNLNLQAALGLTVSSETGSVVSIFVLPFDMVTFWG